MDYKIAFFDMDGTLYQTENNIIEKRTIDDLHRLQANGVKVCAATGRPLNQMGLILKEFPDFDYFVLINGGYVLDKKQNLLFENPLKPEITSDIVDWSEANHNGLMFHFGDASYIYDKFYPFYYFCKDHHVLDYLFYDENRSYHKRHHAYNAVVMTKSAKAVEDFIKEHPMLRSDLIQVSDDHFCYDIFNKENDKSVGIEQILVKENIAWDECVCFGDSTNDITMLSKAGVGVAMGNASDFVKSHANYITDNVYNEGVAKAIEKIFFDQGK